MNLIKVAKEFGSEEDCLAYLDWMRWPDGIRCPLCQCDRYSKVTRKTQTKNKRPQVYTCLNKDCRKQYSATVGTIFHGSHIPIQTWFLAISIIVDAKKGISARQLQEHLGIGSYRSAWYMVHRIRKAMEDKSGFNMTGTVEIDETYIGGKTIRRSNRGNRSIKDKDVVIGMRERGGRVKFVHTPDAKAATVKKVIREHSGARCGARRYRRILDLPNSTGWMGRKPP